MRRPGGLQILAIALLARTRDTAAVVSDRDGARGDGVEDSTFGGGRSAWLERVRDVVRQEMIARQLDEHTQAPWRARNGRGNPVVGTPCR